MLSARLIKYGLCESNYTDYDTVGTCVVVALRNRLAFAADRQKHRALPGTASSIPSRCSRRASKGRPFAACAQKLDQACPPVASERRYRRSGRERQVLSKSGYVVFAAELTLWKPESSSSHGEIGNPKRNLRERDDNHRDENFDEGELIGVAYHLQIGPAEQQLGGEDIAAKGRRG